MKDDVCCHWRFKDEDVKREKRKKKKRTLSENFHLSSQMKVPLTQSQGFGRPGAFRKTLMTTDKVNVKQRRREGDQKREEERRGGGSLW